ncbi:hypothetical protein JVT61DRAFT_3708 [Boletus reticuloceps]|uniref:DUF6830 domain-containing protein n=1 Tax=Boletus reticuloceps TaxID=495285 RepID=A0A8I2YPY8_9AGAM|nr:hypothetical protein JVT61DRAFT_3708 [Boletus reticuloceps]
MYRVHDGHPLQIGGPRQYLADEHLPFEKLQTWHKVYLQQKAYHDHTTPLPSQTLNVCPPNPDWLKGRYDAAFVNIDDMAKWPLSGLEGHAVCELRLIFRPIPPRGQPATWWSDMFLVYTTQFDLRARDPITGMFSLKRSTRSSGIAMGDVFPLTQLRALAPIVPKFGAVADVRLTSRTSSSYSTHFYLNHFFERELFYAIK